MKIVIDIPEELRERLFNIVNYGMDIATGLENEMIMSIVNGTPIPDIEQLTKNMRDTTPEENKGMQEYLSKISKPTGINIYDLLDEEVEELDFVQEHKKIPVSLKLTSWIPTKERLPASNELVDDVDKYYLVQNAYDDMMVAHYDGKGWKQIYDDEYDEVVAWMELPKRYVND